MLTISGVHTFYGNIEALRGVDIEVEAGEIVTLIGANGAGKSTLLMTICGSRGRAHGRIMFEGDDITRMPTYEIMRRGIAQSPEGRRIFPRMSVLENLQMGAITADPSHFDEDLDRVFALFPILKQRQRPARRHAFRRRAADAGDRPSADEPAAAAAARRALAGLGADDRQADLPGHPRDQRAAAGDGIPGRAERLSRAASWRIAAT